MSPRQAHALRSRVKHMQKLGFPKPGVTKGFVASYDVGDVVKVVVAFALLEAGMPSVRACSLVDSVWPEPARAMASMSGDGRKLVVQPYALATVGIRGLVEQDRLETAVVYGDLDEREGTRFSATRILVDLIALSGRLESVLTGGVTTDQLSKTVTADDYRHSLEEVWR